MSDEAFTARRTALSQRLVEASQSCALLHAALHQHVYGGEPLATTLAFAHERLGREVQQLREIVRATAPLTWPIFPQDAPTETQVDAAREAVDTWRIVYRDAIRAVEVRVRVRVRVC